MSVVDVRPTRFFFSKLIVGNLEVEADFYEKVFRLSVRRRISASIGDEPIEEIIMDTGKGDSTEMFILAKFPSRPAPTTGETIVGFVTDDMGALLERATTCGGTVMLKPYLTGAGSSIALLKDPEGHTCQIIQQA